MRILLLLFVFVIVGCDDIEPEAIGSNQMDHETLCLHRCVDEMLQVGSGLTIGDLFAHCEQVKMAFCE